MTEYIGRRRRIDSYHSSGQWQNPGTSIPSVYTVDVEGLEATASRSNPGWTSYKKSGKKGSRVDMGGQFVTAKYNLDAGQIHRSLIPSGVTSLATLTGDLMPVSPSTQPWVVPYDLWGPSTVTGRMFLPSFPSDMTSAGATAVSRCAPTSPHADLATAIGELAGDGLPSLTSATLKGRNRGTFKGVGEDNLKAQFELLPLASDVKSIIHSVRDRGRILAQYARDSGRSVHRRYQFPTEVTRTVVYANDTTRPIWPVVDVFSTQGTLTRVTETRTDTWFSGSFVYHRAGNDNQWNSLLQRYQDANHLLGVGIGPSTAWNLLPWSWAVDWFTNTGDVMKNVQMMMNDGLIMEYGFVMRTQTVTDMYTRYGANLRPQYLPVLLPSVWPATVTRTIKWRDQANPFGFGITYGGLNFRQMSILASLGITRDSRVP